MKPPLPALVRRTAKGAQRLESIVACSVAIAAMSACSLSGTGPRKDSGSGSPAGAVAEFAAEDLPEIAPWDPSDGRCRILVIGDSLVEATERAQEDAFDVLGCEAIVDGLAARTLSAGWQCLADGGASMEIVVRADAEPGNPTCRPSGLELLAMLSDFAFAASATVIALGTNDAARFGRDGWTRHWRRVIELSTGPIVFVTPAARPGNPWVDRVTAYNSALRDWCPSEPRCTIASWDETESANDPASYVDHVHLTRAAGELRAVFIAAAARGAAVPAPPGPSTWKPPMLSLPPAPTSTGPSTTSSGSAVTTDPRSPLDETPNPEEPNTEESSTTSTISLESSAMP